MSIALRWRRLLFETGGTRVSILEEINQYTHGERFTTSVCKNLLKNAIEPGADIEKYFSSIIFIEKFSPFTAREDHSKFLINHERFDHKDGWVDDLDNLVRALEFIFRKIIFFVHGYVTRSCK